MKECIRAYYNYNDNKVKLSFQTTMLCVSLQGKFVNHCVFIMGFLGTKIRIF